MINAQIRLDTFRDNNIPILKIPQGDYLGRELSVTVTALCQKIQLVAQDGVTITACRSDGATKSFEGRADASSGNAIVPITRWMLDVVGEVECWVSVSRGESKYTTNSFLIEVQLVPDYKVAEDGDYTPSDQIIVEINSRISALDRMVELLRARIEGGVARIFNIDTFSGQWEKVIELPFGTTIVKCRGMAVALDAFCFVILDNSNTVLRSIKLSEDDVTNDDVAVNVDVFNIDGAAKCAVSGADLSVGDSYSEGSAYSCRLTVECR